MCVNIIAPPDLEHFQGVIFKKLGVWILVIHLNPSIVAFVIHISGQIHIVFVIKMYFKLKRLDKTMYIHIQWLNQYTQTLKK